MDFTSYIENANNVELHVGKLGQTVKELKKALKNEDRDRTLLFTAFIGECLTIMLNDMHPIMLELQDEVTKNVEDVEGFFKHNTIEDMEGRN